MERYIDANRRWWDELVPLHVASDFYDVTSFKAGRSTLMAVERAEVGDVQGKSLLHLQCHFGMDTLSWAREGARTTGVDFSPRAIETARSLASELGIEARFVESDVYRLPEALSGEFDVVFASYGVTCWLPDFARWAEIAAGFVRRGGFLYLLDDHPVAGALADDSTADSLRLDCPYLGSAEPALIEADGSYATNVRLGTRHKFEFAHGLGEIVSGLVHAGLRIDFLHEFPFCAWQRLPSMEKGDDGYWRLPGEDRRLPFLFSVRASRR